MNKATQVVVVALTASVAALIGAGPMQLAATRFSVDGAVAALELILHPILRPPR